MSSGQNMFTKGQSGELAWVTSSNIPSPLYLFSKILPPVYFAPYPLGLLPHIPGLFTPHPNVWRKRPTLFAFACMYIFLIDFYVSLFK